MTIKELAYSAQQHLQSSAGQPFKRAHVYELLAASFGFNSYAAFSADTVFTQNQGVATLHSTLVKQRCIELGYRPDTAELASAALQSYLAKQQIDVESISTLVDKLRAETFGWEDDPDEDLDEDLDDHARGLVEKEHRELIDPDGDFEFSPILLDGLEAAASKGNALAHYALALIHAPSEEENKQEAGNTYWHSQMQQGRALTGITKNWAESHEAHLIRTEKYGRHLREAGRLGNPEALLDLAENFNDPTFFNIPRRNVDADPWEIAEVAERMGRKADTKHWLTVAAESGNTDAMRLLIEEHDQGDLFRCWIWVYLSQLVGSDLTRDARYAINEDGSHYDDDVGGPAYVGGYEGINLAPLGSDQDATARLAAKNLFARIQQDGDARALS